MILADEVKYDHQISEKQNQTNFTKAKQKQSMIKKCLQ